MEIRLCNFADGLGRRQKIDCVGNEPTFAKGQHFGHGSTALGPEEGVKAKSWLHCSPTGV